MKQYFDPANKKHFAKRITFWGLSEGGRFGFLMLAILLMILVRPFLEGFVAVGLVTDLLFLGIFLSGIYAARGGKYRYRLAMLLAGAGLAARIARYAHGGAAIDFLAEGLGALFFIHALANLAAHLRSERQVTLDLIFASVCAYLLLGLVWAYAYYFLEQIRPGSFKAAEPMGDDLWAFFYYSFVTLTSLGYGDIVAATPPSRSLTIVEVVVGQLYLAILMGRLVGAYSAQLREDRQ